MGKKIAIITLFGNKNYGNRLQNYAIHRLLEKEGFEVETIDFNSNGLKQSLLTLKTKIGIIFGSNKSKRYFAFRRFNKKYLKVRKIKTPNGIMPDRISREYSLFSVGSDQVWNPELRKHERQIMFLQFAQPSQRICISPSIGVSKIESQYENEWRHYLDGFRLLSCREEIGAREIERITGRECETLIDPTLAITAEEWIEFSSERLVPQKKYIFMFFLGKIDSTVRAKVESFAKQNDLMIIEPSDLKSIYYSATPNEFVALIKHASLVFTDSFHVLAFSINLETPFYVFDRHSNDSVNNKMNSRIISLTAMMDLQNRHCVEIKEINLNCNFSKARMVLTIERQRMDQYLNKVLNIEEEK